jgi:hypothetical protein
MTTPESLDFSARLAGELAWLKSEHPDKTALISLGDSHERTVRMAGSCESVSVSFGKPDHPDLVTRAILRGEYCGDSVPLKYPEQVNVRFSRDAAAPGVEQLEPRS